MGRKPNIRKPIKVYEKNSHLFKKFPKSLTGYMEIEQAYLKILKSYCKHNLKINFKSTMIFLFGLSDQNWHRLHESPEEESSNVEKLFESFRLEFDYVYDRFSYSRLLRLHYHWLIFSKRFYKDRMKEHKIEVTDAGYYDYYDHLKWNHQKFLK